MNTNNLKPHVLVVAIVIILGSIYFITQNTAERNRLKDAVTVMPRVSIEEKSKRYELAKEITSPDGFINTNGQPVTIGEFVGKKVVLVDFWTYSCINCQRTTPYLNSWHEKYKDKGLVIIGIHTPEFEFEKNYNNVKSAVEKFGIKFPVVLDNDYSTWTAYRNRYWPRKYLIDIDGYIIYDHIGEGAYEETEKKIQEALTERMTVLEEAGSISDPLTKEVSKENESLSKETYFGALRNEFLGNGKAGVAGLQESLVIPNQISQGVLYLEGDWNIENEFSKSVSVNAGIAYKYTAKEVFFVAEAEEETVVEALLDGKPLGEEAGSDIIKMPDGKTILKIKEARLYKIVKADQLQTHTLKLIIKKSGLKAFTFTFG